jgi:hypothetical protein
MMVYLEDRFAPYSPKDMEHGQVDAKGNRKVESKRDLR